MPRFSRNQPSTWISGLLLLGTIALAARYERRAGAPAPAPEGMPYGEGNRDRAPVTVQRRRALESGRGRRAYTPTDIPALGWKDVFWRVYAEANQDRLLAVAAGVAFFGLLAMFPAITAFVSLYGLFAKASTISDHLSFLAGVMPASAFELVSNEISRIVEKSGGKLGFASLVGLGVALWSANAGMKAIIDALNVIYDEDEKRGFLHYNLLSLGLTLGTICFLLLAIGAVVVFPLMLGWLGLGGFTERAIAMLRWPALFGGMLIGLAVLYRVGPSREGAKWRWLTPGGILAALTWLAGSGLFSWYLANFADYDASYGSLGAVIGLMMWLWLAAISVLVGAELNAEIEHQTARDTTTGPEQPLGVRGAAMADTVGEAQA
jgi:membrane protein